MFTRSHQKNFVKLSVKRKCAVLFIEEQQTILLCFKNGKKAVNLVSESAISKQQVSDIRKNTDKVKCFADLRQCKLHAYIEETN